MAADREAEVVLVRHGETEWSRTRRHTGRTDVPLTEAGRAAARRLRSRLGRWDFGRVLTSPLVRAAETCRLAGLGERAEARPDLVEWDYGEYEGRTTSDIRQKRPDWSLWLDGCPGGETVTDVATRVAPLLEELIGTEGHTALFAHGHVLRVLAAGWLELSPTEGRRLMLGTAAVSVLSREHAARAIRLWNEADRSH